MLKGVVVQGFTWELHEVTLGPLLHSPGESTPCLATCQWRKGQGVFASNDQPHKRSGGLNHMTSNILRKDRFIRGCGKPMFSHFYQLLGTWGFPLW